MKLTKQLWVCKVQGNEFTTFTKFKRLINKSMLSHSKNGKFAPKQNCIQWIDAIDNNGFKFERRYLNKCLHGDISQRRKVQNVEMCN